jgi:hypothetical protein
MLLDIVSAPLLLGMKLVFLILAVHFGMYKRVVGGALGDTRCSVAILVPLYKW